MKRKTIERPFNCWTMTDAELKSSIVSAIRWASRFWKPKQLVIKNSKRGYNLYECSICKTIGPSSLPPLPWKKRKRKNIQADHIVPCVWPDGWKSYDSFIERMFVEPEGLQAICHSCHSKKTKEENEERRLIKKQ